MPAKPRTKPYGKTVQGDRLFAARMNRGLTQDEMAARCGLERTVYLPLENGKNKLKTVPMRRALAKGFGVTLEEMNRYLDEGGYLSAGEPEPLIVREAVAFEARYPNREEAVRFAARTLKISAEEASRHAPVALDADEDPDVFWWLDQIRASHSAAKKGGRLGVREITDD